MTKKRKYWVDKMLSGDDGVSSKRVAGMIVLINIIAFCYAALLDNLLLPDYMFEAICILAGSLLGITAIENVFKKPTPPQENITNEPEQ